jgi:hypothetical protein
MVIRSSFRRLLAAGYLSLLFCAFSTALQSFLEGDLDYPQTVHGYTIQGGFFPENNFWNF